MSIGAISVLEGSAPGVIYFHQQGGSCHITGHVSRLTQGKHGFRIHEYGDRSAGCASTGGLFDPYQKDPSSPTVGERSIGDLGNILADETGHAVVDIVDTKVLLTGLHSVIGRAVVVHEGEDDLGLGGSSDSKTTGHAGGRLSCGVIGIQCPTQSSRSKI